MPFSPATYNIWPAIPGQPTPDWVVEQDYGLVTVEAGKINRDVQIHVTKGVLVEVTVLSTNDLKPLANVAVTSGRLNAGTDANGVALLRMTPGKAYFSASKSHWDRQQTTVEIEPGPANHVQIEMIPTPRITGIAAIRPALLSPDVLVRLFIPCYY